MESIDFGFIIITLVGGVVGFIAFVALLAWTISIGVAWGMRKAREEVEKEVTKSV